MNRNILGCDIEFIRGQADYEDKIEMAKCLGKIILSPGKRNKVIVPSQDEMIGVYALERDDQLPIRKPETKTRKQVPRKRSEKDRR